MNSKTPAPVLADEQIMELAKAHTWFNGSHAITNYVAFARAILLAAGAAPPESGWCPRLTEERDAAAQRVDAFVQANTAGAPQS